MSQSKDPNSNSLTKFPKLIVLDLDNTVWTPELYQLRRKMQRSNPVAGRDVKLFPGTQDLVDAIRSKQYFPPTTKFAIASRTQSVDWAHDLLSQFQIRNLFDFVEIFPGNKVRHFENLRQNSGVDFEDMLFFDDARDGKYGNCEPVADLGVLSVHCPSGLDTRSVWETGLEKFEEWDQQPNTIVEWDGSVTNPKTLAESRQEGTIKTINYDKRFGFIQYGGGRGRDMFFHFSGLPNGVSPSSLEKGDKLRFTVETDPRNGKPRAGNIEVVEDDTKDQVRMRAFSMNLPFAALLANSYKDLESRNGTMFKPYPEGTQMLLHVGRRTYPDGNRHLEIMQDQEDLSDDEVKRLKSLPKGFDRGMVVAILEIGKTYETTTAERSTPEMQKRICAYGSDSGRIVTEIAKVSYLKKPCPMPAQGGVFKVSIPRDAVPDDWELPQESNLPAAYRVKPEKRDGENGARLVYSITG